MPFVTLTRTLDGKIVHARVDAIVAIAPAARTSEGQHGCYVHVGSSGWAVLVTESPQEILAAIAAAEPSGVEITEEMTREAWIVWHAELDNGATGKHAVKAAIEAALKARRP
jgi:hypothetical protein